MRNVPMPEPDDLDLTALTALSERIGRDPLLTQASSGNTSIKLDGTLWIKASGTWLADACGRDTFIPLNLADLRQRLRSQQEFTGVGALVNGSLRPASVETSMHAILPHKVVVHVHSVNAIAWAVRADGAEKLAGLLQGIDWTWVPYVPSGVPLARSIDLAAQSHPATNVFVLANHGLVVCGASCNEVETLLNEVEHRVSLSRRPTEQRFDSTICYLAGNDWQLPEMDSLHTLATDPISCKIVHGGTLFPCQSIFLGTSALLVVDGRGVLVHHGLNASQRCVLQGLLEVVQRIPAGAPVRYLSDAEVTNLLTEDAHRYHLSTEINAPAQLRAANSSEPSIMRTAAI
jgi:rhamnose utilization protein RhaD (predicted bifunctional aldolase and dehydrogenase)